MENTDYCPAEKLEDILNIILFGGLRNFMKEPSTEYEVDLFKEDATMPKELRFRKTLFQLAREKVQERNNSEIFFRYCPNIEIPECSSIGSFYRKENEIEMQIKKNIQNHVLGCESCSNNYIQILIDRSKKYTQSPFIERPEEKQVIYWINYIDERTLDLLKRNEKNNL